MNHNNKHDIVSSLSVSIINCYSKHTHQQVMITSYASVSLSLFLECPSYCDQCLPSLECLSCTYAKYNGTCYPSSTCPNGGMPNPQKGNECECRMNYGGSNCDGMWDYFIY